MAYGGDAPANWASRPGLGSTLDKRHLVESSTRLLTRFCNQPGTRGGNRGFDPQGAFGVVISTSFNTVVTGTLNLGPWSGSRGCRNHARHLPVKGVSRCWGCFLSPELPSLAGSASLGLHPERPGVTAERSWEGSSGHVWVALRRGKGEKLTNTQSSYMASPAAKK